jgi:hypothetical protein
MKTASCFLLLFAFAGVHSGYAQSSGWIWQHPLPQGNPLNSVDFIDASTGWAAGEAGTILHTADAGATWAVRQSGVGGDIRDVYFADAQHGWAVTFFLGAAGAPVPPRRRCLSAARARSADLRSRMALIRSARGISSDTGRAL